MSLNLIYDRTAADVERAQYLNDLWVGGVFLGTAEELTEWFTDLKGAYNAGDLNRVEGAVDYLAGALRDLVAGLKAYAAERDVGWDAIFAPPFDPSEMYPATKRDWTVRDIPTPADMELYLSNIKLLRSALVYNTDALPASMENLTWSGANAIEKALFALDGAIILFNADMRLMIDKAVATMFYSNEIYSGEV